MSPKARADVGALVDGPAAVPRSDATPPAHDTGGIERRQVSRRRLSDVPMTWRVIGLLAGALIWEAYARAADNILIPPFSRTMISVIDLADDMRLWEAMLISNQAMVLGFVITVVIGLPVGLLLGRLPWAARFTGPYVNILLVSPTAAFIPLLIMWTGIGLTSRVILIVMIALPYLIINCRSAIGLVNPQLIEMARCFQATELQLWRKILMRAGLPLIMTGIRIALGRAIEGMIIVELIMASVGLGNLILEFQATFQPDLLYALVVYVIIEAVILAYLSRWLERRATPWIDRRGGQ